MNTIKPPILPRFAPRPAREILARPSLRALVGNAQRASAQADELLMRLRIARESGIPTHEAAQPDSTQLAQEPPQPLLPAAEKIHAAAVGNVAPAVAPDVAGQRVAGRPAAVHAENASDGIQRTATAKTSAGFAAHQRAGLASGWVVATVFTGVAILCLFSLSLDTASDTNNLSRRLSKVEAVAGARDGFIQDQIARQNAVLALLAENVAEVRRPPARFLAAQDLFQAGRYADAEAHYGALLIERPTSALTPPILVNSALANAMLGNCSMVKGRLDQLKIAAPRDPLLARVPALAKECGMRRSLGRQPA